jgi:hypothetical protein
VTATIPVEKMSEFVDEPLYGVLEVEPLAQHPRAIGVDNAPPT